MSGLKRLWRGELSLPITFWLFGVGGLYLLFLPLIVLDRIYPDPDATPLLAAVLYRISFFFAIIYFIFIFVAICSSAWKYRGQLLKRVSDGEFSLPVTYWLYGWLVLFAIIIPLFILTLIFSFLIEAPWIAEFLFVIFTLFVFLYIGNICNGIMSSANKYEGWKIWRGLAKLTVLFAYLLFIIVWVTFVAYIFEGE